MKTLQLYLSLMAVLFSVAGALASATTFQNPVYQFIDNPGVEDDYCVAASLDCFATGPFSM
jgi:hypothetical protein